MFNMKAFEVEMTRFAIFSVAIEVIAVILFFLVLYWVIKSAIRDGINESRLGERQRAIAKREDAEGLPPMRAER